MTPLDFFSSPAVKLAHDSIAIAAHRDTKRLKGETVVRRFWCNVETSVTANR